MDEFQEKQLKMMKRQQTCMLITAICTACTFIVITMVAVKVMSVVPMVDDLYQRMVVISENLDHVSTELVEANIGETLKNFDTLITDAGTDMTGAMEKINSIDIETLNESIQKLDEVVTPMSEFFGRFN
ncbi:MAG: hypothetical protein K5682_02925 [Lachnospiraceae bacterium]|nr:hypothetical protein [Lachnospiraceae bacterium]